MNSACRVLWVGTSWKMNKTVAEAMVYIDRLATVDLPAQVQVFVLPAHTALASVRDRLPSQSSVMLGAQNAHWSAEGAITGEVSMRMVAEAGATLVEIGHSERREQFGDSDQVVARKVAAASVAGLIPLVCVGEPDQARIHGRAEVFVANQVRSALSMISPEDVQRVIIAYEPIWAIGNGGRPATAAEVAPVITAITQSADSVSGRRALRAVLYGGGVNPDNADVLLSNPQIDGVFVGRAGWDVETFIQLIDQLTQTRVSSTTADDVPHPVPTSRGVA